MFGFVVNTVYICDMDRSKTNCYVYAHMRNDTGAIFYVGIGSQKNYKRAFSLVGRNRLWLRIANKHGYTVCILYKELSWAEACEKEIELVNMYGRVNTGTGTLCNMTDGGEGANGAVRSEEYKKRMSEERTGLKQSDETISKRVAKNTGKKRTKEQKERMSKAATGKTFTKEHRENISKVKKGVKMNPDKLDGILRGLEKAKIAAWLATSKVVINMETGVLYDSITDAARSLNHNRTWLGKRLSGKIPNNTSMLYA